MSSMIWTGWCKGRSFTIGPRRIVFVIWLADGRFPNQRAMRVPGGIVRLPSHQVPEALQQLVGGMAEEARVMEATTPPSSADAPAPTEIVVPGEEEERRLFYVAITRARQELYLVFPVMARDRGGMDVLMEPSRFVRELPGGLYEKWVIGSE